MVKVFDLTKESNGIKDNEHLEVEKTYKGKWKNLIFAKDGKTYFGRMIHDSEEIAYKVSVETDKLYEQGIINVLYVIDGPVKDTDGETCIWFKDISHTIQIPYKEA